jgi:glc operon protein GlcG
MNRLTLFSMAVCTALVFGTSSYAQQQPASAGPPPAPRPYGAPITLEQARKVAAAAEAESRKGLYPMAIAIVEPSGDLVLLIKLENTQYAGPEIAIRKARTSARFRLPTTVFFNAVEAGHPYLMSLTPDLTAADGGTVIVENGKVIGAIGVSGAPAGSFDAAVARAGAAVIQ